MLDELNDLILNMKGNEESPFEICSEGDIGEERSPDDFLMPRTQSLLDSAIKA